jgi:glutathione synthase
MIHSVPGDNRTLLQVEINTIASSFGSLSAKVAQMYKLLTPHDVSETIPPNEALEKISMALNFGHCEFLSQFPSVQQAVVVMVVQPNESNFADQRLLEFTSLQMCGLRIIRASLEELSLHSKLTEDDKFLVFKEDIVSLVYFRAGYTPNDYPTQACWEARLLIERSAALKCPCIAYHLAGTKKIQQELTGDGVLEHFLLRDEDKAADGYTAVNNIAALRNVFARQYSLDPTESTLDDIAELKTKVAANPSGYVLKPQREGGSNNFYDDALVNMLRDNTAEELSAYVLMEKIKPTEQSAVLVKRNESIAVSSNSHYNMV